MRCGLQQNSHQTHQHPTHNYSTVRVFLRLSLVSLFPCFLSGSHSFSTFHHNTFSSSAGRSRNVPCDQKVLRPFSTTSNPSRQSLSTSRQAPHSLSQYACPKLWSHAFEQDVLGCPRSAGHLHDRRHRHHIQLCPDDCHHWC